MHKYRWRSCIHVYVRARMHTLTTHAKHINIYSPVLLMCMDYRHWNIHAIATARGSYTSMHSSRRWSVAYNHIRGDSIHSIPSRPQRESSVSRYAASPPELFRRLINETYFYTQHVLQGQLYIDEMSDEHTRIILYIIYKIYIVYYIAFILYYI